MLRLLICLLVASLAACCDRNSGKAEQATSFRLYYGGNLRSLRDMASGAAGAVLVWDSRQLSGQVLPALLKQARREQAISLGYVSIGELDAQDLERARRSGVDQAHAALEYNDKFQSWRIDVADPAWRRWVLSETDRLATEGFSGFFLDTPDTVDRYISHPRWSRTQRGERARAMRDLVRAVKQRHPHHFVLLNRGLNLIGAQIWMNESGSDTEAGLALVKAHPYNPDAVLYENAFASTDAWTQRIESDLAAIAHAGHTQIFALGYADTAGNATRFFASARQAGFVAAWAASSTTLHEAPTQTEKEMAPVQAP